MRTATILSVVLIAGCGFNQPTGGGGGSSVAGEQEAGAAVPDASQTNGGTPGAQGPPGPEGPEGLAGDSSIIAWGAFNGQEDLVLIVSGGPHEFIEMRRLGEGRYHLVVDYPMPLEGVGVLLTSYGGIDEDSGRNTVSDLSFGLDFTDRFLRVAIEVFASSPTVNTGVPVDWDATFAIVVLAN